MTGPHRHNFLASDPYRVCRTCRCVQRKVSGRWVGGSQAANPTEQKNIVRRVLTDPTAYGFGSKEAT